MPRNFQLKMAKIFDANLEFVREDDYVEYFIFPQLSDVDQSAQESHTENNIFVRKQLEQIKEQCLQLAEKLMKERHYIWHKDEFQLQVRTCSKEELLLNDESTTGSTATAKMCKQSTVKQEGKLPPHLHGVTHYGDNITDEWFIVFLLKELTKHLTHCVVRVVDADGEFLLIEAADLLPKWANPDTCEQRVYLADGHLHLVQNSPSNTLRILPVQSAVNKIRMNPTLYRVSKDIQQCIEQRLKEFATHTNPALHHQIVRLPVGIAMLLKVRPDLIAAAIRAFCERDPIDMKACRSMLYFPPEQRVRMNVCFTRCLYAMLMHNKYMPERKIGWNLNANPNTEEYKEDLLGIKLACGFEILASQAKRTEENVENSSAWKTYKTSLQAKGYFHDNLKGSQEYQRLLAQAKMFFLENQARFRTAPLVGKEILQLLKTLDINVDELKDEENNLKPSDADDWLNITAEQLDSMLMQRYGPKKLYKSNGDLNAEEFTKNITEFLEKQSTFEGVTRTSDDDSTDEEQVKAVKSKKEKKEGFHAKVKKSASMRKACRQNVLDSTLPDSSGAGGGEDNFTEQMRSFLNFTLPEDTWDSQSEMSDYEDDDDIEGNFSAMVSTGQQIDNDIKAYMDEMDKELANTTIGQTFDNRQTTSAANSHKRDTSINDDFDDIEDFEPIDINVNTLKNIMDSYKSQLGGTGPVTHLFNAMGVGMSAALNESENEQQSEKLQDLTESTV